MLYLKRSETSGRIEVDLGIVREIIFLESSNSGTFWSENSLVHVTLKNGQESEFFLADRIYDFQVSLFDSFTESVQRTTVDDAAVARIVFGDDFGNVRINPDTGKIWPPSGGRPGERGVADRFGYLLTGGETSGEGPSRSR